jgi:hypothetical protein
MRHRRSLLLMLSLLLCLCVANCLATANSHKHGSASAAPHQATPSTTAPPSATKQHSKRLSKNNEEDDDDDNDNAPPGAIRLTKNAIAFNDADPTRQFTVNDEDDDAIFGGDGDEFTLPHEQRLVSIAIDVPKHHTRRSRSSKKSTQSSRPSSSSHASLADNAEVETEQYLATFDATSEIWLQMLFL